MRAAIIIPARLESQRLPRKVLADLAGKPLVVRTWENACRAQGFSAVVVATDSPEVEQSAIAAGAQVIRTAAHHQTGSDRCAEAARMIDADIIVNLQVDEPFVVPEDISRLAASLMRETRCEMATMRFPLQGVEELQDPNVVKVVCTADSNALYFSRAPIPFARGGGFCGGFRHVGIYGFRAEFLMAFAATLPQKLEKIERLEQLRALAMGARIHLCDASTQPLGIDTPEDLERTREIIKAGTGGKLHSAF